MNGVVLVESLGPMQHKVRLEDARAGTWTFLPTKLADACGQFYNIKKGTNIPL
jgi:hypothetical protein